jgi:hypothetical protein
MRSTTNDEMEYAALAVYDEILNDFVEDDEDLSSYAYSHAGSSDDEDSIGTIISQWSQGQPGEGDFETGNGNGGGYGRGRHGHGGGRSERKIEMIPFDDGHLTLTEING